MRRYLHFEKKVASKFLLRYREVGKLCNTLSKTFDFRFPLVLRFPFGSGRVDLRFSSVQSCSKHGASTVSSRAQEPNVRYVFLTPVCSLPFSHFGLVSSLSGDS